MLQWGRREECLKGRIKKLIYVINFEMEKKGT